MVLQRTGRNLEDNKLFQHSDAGTSIMQILKTMMSRDTKKRAINMQQVCHKDRKEKAQFRGLNFIWELSASDSLVLKMLATGQNENLEI